MPFRFFAFLVLGVIAASALSVWLVATAAIRFNVAPVPGFAVFAALILIVTFLVRRRNG